MIFVPATTGTIVGNLLDAVPCVDSITCYASLSFAMLYQSEILFLEMGALKKIDNTYLAKNSGLNNQFVPNANIALNAIGYYSPAGLYYKSLTNKSSSFSGSSSCSSLMYQVRVWSSGTRLFNYANEFCGSKKASFIIDAVNLILYTSYGSSLGGNGNEEGVQYRISRYEIVQ